MYGLSGCECENGNGQLAGLGISMDTVQTFAQFDPTGFSQAAVAGADIVQRAWATLESMFGIGKGRREADILVPFQNELGNRLVEINNAIPTANVPQLQSFYAEVARMGIEWTEFVMSDQFVQDGDYRASTGSLNTIMPLIDGTDANGNLVRQDKGTLGTIERRIQALGGTVAAPQITQGYGTSYPTLRYPSQNFPYIPQAGTIPPNAPLSSIVPNMSTVSASIEAYLPMAIMAGLAYTILSKRR